MKVVEYDPSRRGDVAGLMERVWGKRPSEDELAWFYEGNPVRPASVLLAEEDGKTVGTTALSFVRMSIGGEEREVAMAVRLATDPAFRGRGVFAQLIEEHEERARDLGISLLLSVTNKASTPILVERLGWSKLPPVRVWARTKLHGGRAWVRPAAQFDTELRPRPIGSGDRVLRDSAWLNWRFAEGPGSYTRLIESGRTGSTSYAVSTRWRGCGVVAAMAGDLFRDVAIAAGGPLVLAAPPPAERRRYLFGGYLPTPKSFTVVGKALTNGVPLPERPHFELGDLDFL